MDPTAPPDPSETGLAADILRDIIPRADNDRDRRRIMAIYYCGEPHLEDTMWGALAYASEKGMKLDKSYLPGVLELGASIDYGDVMFEYVDFNIFEDGDEATQLEPSLKRATADVLREVLLQVPNEEERKRILAPLHNEDYQVEDLVWVALDYAAKNDIKLEKVYWPHLARLAQAINREDLLEEVDRSIFE
ncbi:MAG: hypothetical protein Q4E01_04585 [Actinomycetaceae bacterium]|nr:hypothetical protein [Actinomycetaceae bacterium]